MKLQPLREDDKSDLKAAASATGGAIGAQGVYLSGYGGKYYTLRQRNKKGMTSQQKKTLAQHRKTTPNPQFFRKYPKGLPGWKTQRMLGWTHGGKTGLATSAAMMTGGGILGYKGYQKHKKSKIQKDDRIGRLKEQHRILTEKYKSSPNMSAKNRENLKRQIDGLSDRISRESAGTYTPPPTSKPPKQPKAPPAPKPTRMEMIRGAKIKKPGFLVPAGIAAGVGVTGYGVHRQQRSPKKFSFKSPWN